MSQFVTETNAAETAEKAETKPAEGAEKPTEAAAEEPEEPAKPTVQQRINELTRLRREAEAREADLRERLARLEGAAKPQEQTKPAEDAEPDPSDAAKYPYGELDKGYLRDFAAYTARQEHKRLQAEAEQQRKAQEAQQQQNDVRGKIQAMARRGEGKYEDFQDTINAAAAAGAQLSPELALLLAESDVGEDVVYHLAKHPDEAKALVAKAPLAMAAAFGKLEARFTKTEEKKPAATQAPPPPSHDARGANGRFSVTADTDDFAAFERQVMEAQRQRAS
jgi:hypothetical protein